MKSKALDVKKGDSPMRASEALVAEPAKSWQRLAGQIDLPFQVGQSPGKTMAILSSVW